MELHYRRFKRRRNGPCNICGVQGPLTWDHVPPQGSIELQPVEIDRVAADLVSSLALEKPEVSQDGVKFRTLCARCNNDRLGASFDPALIEFARVVSRFLQTTLILPPVLQAEVRPNAIIRSVLRHLVAARLSLDPGLFDTLVNDLLDDPVKPLPAEINVFYWIHPYAQQIVLRDALMPAVRGQYGDFQRFGVLKFFPLAFLVTTAPVYEGLAALSSWRDKSSHFRTRVSVDLRGARDPYWPEAPAPDNWLFGGNDLLESIRAHPKPSIFNPIQPGG